MYNKILLVVMMSIISLSVVAGEKLKNIPPNFQGDWRNVNDPYYGGYSISEDWIDYSTEEVGSSGKVASVEVLGKNHIKAVVETTWCELGECYNWEKKEYDLKIIQGKLEGKYPRINNKTTYISDPDDEYDIWHISTNLNEKEFKEKIIKGFRNINGYQIFGIKLEDNNNIRYVTVIMRPNDGMEQYKKITHSFIYHKYDEKWNLEKHSDKYIEK